MALVGGLGIVAEACGVNVLSDAVAGSKIYANVQNSKARKKALNAATSTATHSTTAQVPQAVHHINNASPNGHTPVVQNVTPQGTHHAPQVLQHQNVAPHVGQGGHMNSLPMFSPVHQQIPHQQFIPAPSQHPHHVPHLSHHLSNQQDALSTDPSAQFNQNQNQNAQFQYNGQQSPVQYYQPADNSQFQSQQPDPSQLYQMQQGSFDQNGQGNSGGLVSDACNLLAGGQVSNYQLTSIFVLMYQKGNPPSQPQSPTPSTSDTQSLLLQQQIPTLSTSPFDPSSQLQQSSSPAPSNLTFDPATQQLPTPSASPFDPSSQILPQQVLQDQAATQISNQAIDGSQQFTNDLLGQSILNSSIQDDNSYITSPSPTQSFTLDLPGQDMLNASILDDNSYVSAPPSPTLNDSASNFGDYDALSQGLADQDAAIF